MDRRVSKLAAAVLALVISLSAPTAFAATRGRDINPGIGPRIVKILKSFGKKLGLVTTDDCDFVSPNPPRP
jgi:hypothetical protein